MKELNNSFKAHNFKELTTKELTTITGGGKSSKPDPTMFLINAIGVIFNTLTGN